MLTLKKIWEQRTEQTPSRGLLSIGGSFDFLEDYERYKLFFDEVIVKKFGSLVFSKTETDRDYTDYNNMVLGLITMNKYKYEKLFATMSLQYNPLDNYREHYKKTITGTHTNTKNGNMTESREANNEDIRTGSIENTNTPNLSTTDTRSSQPYDVSTWKDEEKNVTTSTGTNTDSTEFHSVKDAHNIDESKSTNYTNIKDVESWENYEEEITEDGCSRGDTSQHLIDEERRVAMFNFYMIIYDDVLENLFSGVFL